MELVWSSSPEWPRFALPISKNKDVFILQHELTLWGRREWPWTVKDAPASPRTHLVAGDLLQRPGSSVACTAVLTLHDPDDLWGSLLVGRRVLTR